MKESQKISVLLIFIVYSMSVSAKSRIDSLLNILDIEIKNCHKYEEEKKGRIMSLRNKVFGSSFDSEYKYYMDLYNEYIRFCYDSAHYYLNKSIEVCDKYKKELIKTETLAELSHLYAQTGNVIEAYQVNQALLKRNSLDQCKVKYYIANEKLYDVLAETNKGSMKKKYESIRNSYTDSIDNKYPINMDRYWELKINDLYKKGKTDECHRIWEENSQYSRQYAVLGYYLGCCYMNSGKTDKALECFIMASIADVRSATRDQGALPVISECLLSKGYIRKAYEYIIFSCNQTLKHNGKLRVQCVLPLLASIESEYNDFMAKSRQKFIVSILFISILSLLLLISFVYIYNLYKKVKMGRSELQKLYENNIKLTESIKSINEQLESANKELRISNTIMEKYVLHFIKESSDVIAKIGLYNNKLKKIALNSNAKNVLNFLSESDFAKIHLKELYKGFDKAFLHIYPNFVENFNNLLLDDYKIHLKNNESLTTDLRIYALEKLGIADNNEIATFLRCSVNTIYNYKTKIKSGLKVSKKEFEDFIHEK